MRRGNTSLYSAAANGAVMQMRADEQASLQPKLEAPAPVDPLTLPVMQQAALMRLHESVVSRTIYRDLLEGTLGYPQVPEFRALAARSLCEYKVGKRQNELTSEGRFAAKQLERALCIRFGIHVMTGFDPSTTSSGDTSRGCSCGGWRWTGRAGQYTDSNAGRAHAQHVTTAVQLQNMLEAMKPPAKIAAEGR